jgi:hypothetical protein
VSSFSAVLYFLYVFSVVFFENIKSGDSKMSSDSDEFVEFVLSGVENSNLSYIIGVFIFKNPYSSVYKLCKLLSAISFNLLFLKPSNKFGRIDNSI